jgi:uncharacterized protein YkwD
MLSRMKTHPAAQFVALVCAGALASCANSPEPTRIPVSTTLRPDTSISSLVVRDVNAYRRSKGAQELQRHSGLDRLAQEHSEYLRKHRGTFVIHGKNVSHSGFEGRTLIARQRYQMISVSENVAAASKRDSAPSTVLVGLWKGSKDHHKNMIDKWTHTGVGVVVDSDGMVFATQLFSTMNYSQIAARDRFSRY